MSIKIVLPEGDGPRPSTGTRVFTDGGTEIEGVMDIIVTMSPQKMITAYITVEASSIENLEGLEAFISVDKPATNSDE